MLDEPSDNKRRLNRALAGDVDSTDEVRALMGYLTDQLRDANVALVKCEQEMEALRAENRKRDARIIALEAERQRLMILLDETTVTAAKLEQALEERSVGKNEP